jgi:hypothetical protein
VRLGSIELAEADGARLGIYRACSQARCRRKTKEKWERGTS